MPFELPPLPYAKDALEPSIDALTMELHHDKHHAAYTNNLNAALQGTQWDGKPIEEILRNLGQLPADKQTAVRNNGGGYFNHNLFWSILAPKGKGGQPDGELADAIKQACGGFDEFKAQFADAGMKRFGSGWAWLCVTPEKKLHVVSTANQDTTFMPKEFGGMGQGHTPILGLDVWEHAYYKKYGPARADYIKAWWDVVNWAKVAENFRKARG